MSPPSLISRRWYVPDELQSKEFSYAVVRIDCRGVGGTPGILDPWSLQRTIEMGQDAEGNGKHSHAATFWSNFLANTMRICTTPSNGVQGSHGAMERWE